MVKCVVMFAPLDGTRWRKHFRGLTNQKWHARHVACDLDLHEGNFVTLLFGFDTCFSDVCFFSSWDSWPFENYQFDFCYFFHPSKRKSKFGGKKCGRLSAKIWNWFGSLPLIGWWFAFEHLSTRRWQHFLFDLTAVIAVLALLPAKKQLFWTNWFSSGCGLRLIPFFYNSTSEQFRPSGWTHSVFCRRQFWLFHTSIFFME